MRALPRPWAIRLLEAAPVEPVWIGVAIALTVLGFYFGVELSSGMLEQVITDGDPHFLMHYRITTVTALSLGFLPTAQVYLSRWTARHLAELQPLLPEVRSEAADPFLRSGRRTAGLVGALVVAGAFIGPSYRFFLTPEYWIFEHAIDWIFVPLLGWMAGRLVYAMVADARLFSRLAERIEHIDLFDRERYAPPFVHQGLRSALLMVFFLAINAGLVGVVVISPTAGTLAMLATASVATAALILPVRGIHRRIRAEKRARLSELRGEIRSAEHAVLTRGPGSEGEAVRLPALLALEQRVAGVREWPFDAGSLARFALYVALGLGSWVGAAAVERALEMFWGGPAAG